MLYLLITAACAGCQPAMIFATEQQCRAAVELVAGIDRPAYVAACIAPNGDSKLSHGEGTFEWKGNRR